MADGSEVRILGTMNLPLFIDNQVIHQLMLVADIEIHVVLGFDFMNQNKCVIDVFRGLSDTLIRFNGITSFVSEHRDLATKIPLFLVCPW
jgi:hypothetical protein